MKRAPLALPPLIAKKRDGGQLDDGEIEAVVVRLRSRMGQLEGFARVNGEVVADGAMTFALE